MGSSARPRGLICAGGEATRLAELTRVTNKHLLPVGDWPMADELLRRKEHLQALQAVMAPQAEEAAA